MNTRHLQFGYCSNKQEEFDEKQFLIFDLIWGQTSPLIYKAICDISSGCLPLASIKSIFSTKINLAIYICVSSYNANSSGCFTFIVLCPRSVPLHHGAMGRSTVCEYNDHKFLFHVSTTAWSPGR